MSVCFTWKTSNHTIFRWLSLQRFSHELGFGRNWTLLLKCFVEIAEKVVSNKPIEICWLSLHILQNIQSILSLSPNLSRSLSLFLSPTHPALFSSRSVREHKICVKLNICWCWYKLYCYIQFKQTTIHWPISWFCLGF